MQQLLIAALAQNAAARRVIQNAFNHQYNTGASPDQTLTMFALSGLLVTLEQEAITLRQAVSR